MLIWSDSIFKMHGIYPRLTQNRKLFKRALGGAKIGRKQGDLENEIPDYQFIHPFF